MSPHMEFTISDQDDGAEAKLIHERLKAHVEASVGASARRGFVIAGKDENGDLLAGARGFSHWSWLYISHFWVEAAARGRGLGAEVMKKIEREARDRGCRAMYVDTFDPRAAEFYRDHGFENFGELAEFPPGHRRIFLMKKL